MKIIMHYADNFGCGFYRIQQPGKYIAKYHEVEITETIKLAERADIIVLQRQVENSIHQAAELRDHCTLIYENDDDLFNLVPYNKAFDHYQPRRQILLDYVNLCHGLQVSTQPLKEVHEKLHAGKNIEVLPNAIDFSLMKERKKNKSIILGFAGSHSHWKDLHIIMPAILNILRKNKNVVFHSIGFNGITKYGNVYRNIPFGQYKYTEFTQTVPELYDAIDFDIGLIPNEDIKFNKSKSNIKYLEYGAKGVAPIASKIYPFLNSIDPNKTGLLCKTLGAVMIDWERKIQRLIDDTQLRLSIQNNAYNHVKQNFDIENVVQQYLNYYETIQKHS